MATPHIYNLTPQTGRMIDDEDNMHNVVDKYGSLKVIDPANSSVHEGTSFTYSATTSIVSLATAYFMGRNGAKVGHLIRFVIDADNAPILVEFFEAPTVTAPGTLQTPLNRNRVLNAAPTMAVYAAPTISADGTRLMVTKILGANKTIGGSELGGEWLLKPSTDYIFKVTNSSNQTANVTAAFDWIEY